MMDFQLPVLIFYCGLARLTVILGVKIIENPKDPGRIPGPTAPNPDQGPYLQVSAVNFPEPRGFGSRL